MFCCRSTDSINSHCQASVGAVLEANGERETRRQFTVELGFRCPGTNGAKGDEVCKELWRDGVEHLRGNGHTSRCKVNKELARDPKALVDLVRLVNVWVIDQALPADCCSWLLEVGAHDDAEVVLKLVGQGLETLAVLDGQFWVVERAGPNHDEEAVILLCDDAGSIFASLEDRLLGMVGDGKLLGEELGRDEWVITKYCAAMSVPLFRRRFRQVGVYRARRRWWFGRGRPCSWDEPVYVEAAKVL